MKNLKPEKQSSIKEELDFLKKLREDEKDLLDDDEMCENLDDHVGGDELFGDEDEYEDDDPVTRQLLTPKKKSSNKYSIWA